MRPIDADEVRKHAVEVYQGNGTELETIMMVPLKAIDNAPTVPLPDFKEGYKQAILDGKTNYSRPEDWCENCAFAKFADDVAKKLEEL